MDDDYVTPDRKYSALLIIDVQSDFTLTGASMEIPGTCQCVHYIKRLAQCYRELGLPIVHVIRLYHKDGSNVDLCRRKAVENGKQFRLRAVGRNLHRAVGEHAIDVHREEADRGPA